MGLSGCGWVWLLIHYVVKCAQYVHIGVWFVCSGQVLFVSRLFGVYPICHESRGL